MTHVLVPDFSCDLFLTFSTRALSWGLRYTRRSGWSARDLGMRVQRTGVMPVGLCGLVLVCRLGGFGIGDIRGSVPFAMCASPFVMTWR